MKNIYILFFFLNPFFGDAQNISNNTGIVTYEQTAFSYKKVTVAQLFFSNEKSFYVCNRGVKGKVVKFTDGEILDIVDKEKGIKQMMAHPNIEVIRHVNDEEGNIVYMNWKTDSLIFREILENDPIIVVEPNLPKLNWKITSEAKKIGTFSCLKATTLFRGRNYEAWFTLDIPIPSGPWKLHGLPGLILEAKDLETQFKYIFKSIEIPLKDKSELSKMPKTGDIIFLPDYTETLKAKEQAHIRKMTSKVAARGMVVSMLPSEEIPQELNFEQ